MDPNVYIEMAETEAHHWWLVGRRAILTHIIRTFNLPPDTRIIEIGSGTGGNLQMLSSFGLVSALEMDATARSISEEKTCGRFDIRSGSCPTDIPFGEDKFDLICLFDVLERIDDDVDTLIAVKKLLSDGGRVLLNVPAYRLLWSAHDKFLHHKRRHSAEELRRKVLAIGFKPVKLTYFNTILFPLTTIVRFKDRLFRNSSASGTGIPFAPVNQLFASLFGLERFMIGKFNLPFGLSLLCVLRSGHL